MNKRNHKFSHLEKHKSDWRFDWTKNLFEKTMPSTINENLFLSNFMKALEQILIKGFVTSYNIQKYFKF